MQLTLFLNHRCNLSCRYCYNGRHFNRAMSPEVARRAVDFGLDRADKGWLLLAFFGGEPLLELDHLEQIVAYAEAEGARRGKRLFYSISTNGTRVDERALALFKRHGFRVQVSMDGDAAAHDATRPYRNGRPSHAAVDAGVRRLLDAGFALRLVSVIDPANVERLAASFDYLLTLGAPHLYFAPNYSGVWDEAACERFEVALRELGERYVAMFRAGGAVRVDPLNGKIVTHLISDSNQRVRCGFGVEEMAVSPSGKLYPCDRLVREDADPAMCIGDLERGLDTAKRDGLLELKKALDPECAGCELRGRCMHWCGCANFETTGSPAAVSPLLCWFERCVIAEADRVAAILYEEKNPAFLRRFYVRGAKGGAGAR